MSGMPLLAAALEVFPGLYWFFLIVGGGLILISTLSVGGNHAGMDADVAANADLGLGADANFDAHPLAASKALGLSKWLSLSFAIYGGVAFGATGLVLTHVAGARGAGAVVLAAAAGLIVGQAVHQLLRKVRSTSGDSAPRPQDYVHKLARVTVALPAGGTGEIALSVRGTTRYVPATPASPAESFPAGCDVVVVAYRAGVAEVVAAAGT